MHTATRSNAGTAGPVSLWERLRKIEIGPSRDPANYRIPGAKLADLLHLLMMLLQNGLSLPKALAALCEDRAARRWVPLLTQLRIDVQRGGSLSGAMSRFPRTFTPMQIQQIRLGERTGALERSLGRIHRALQSRIALRQRILKKISYPALVCLAGGGLIVFMVLFVVPQFESVFSSSGVSLPMVTRVVTGASRFMMHYGVFVAMGVVAVIAAVILMRRRPRGALLFDGMLLHIPVLGGWLRDAATLQFAEATLAMIESGYTPVDAVGAAVPCVRNRRVRAAVDELRINVQRGERLSTEMARYPQFFPATLCQLVSVGERSGDFPKAMSGVCNHLQSQLERRIDLSVGTIEPVLTLGLAALIGAVVMAIYMPMFSMFEVLE